MSEWHGADIRLTEKELSINGMDLSNCVVAGSVVVNNPGGDTIVPSIQLTILADKITIERSDSGK